METIAINLDRLPTNMRGKVADLPNGCWEWTGALNSKGYGCTTQDGAQKLVHRVAYEALIGPIPEGLQLDHLCEVNQERRPGTHKSHCKNGHRMDPDNTIVKCRPNGLVQWNCRECERVAQRRRRAQRACLSDS